MYHQVRINPVKIINGNKKSRKRQRGRPRIKWADQTGEIGIDKRKFNRDRIQE